MKKVRYHLKHGQATNRKFPIVGPVALYLLLDKFNAPEWLLGIFFFCVLIIYAIVFYDIYKYEEREVDISTLLKGYYEAQEQQRKIKEQQEAE